MKRGTLRHRITLQELQTVQDPDTGILAETWADVAQVWAAIEPMSAREFVASQSVQSAVTARIVIEYRPGVRAKMRAVHGARYYDIHGVLSDKASGLDYLTLPVSEGVSDGR